MAQLRIFSYLPNPRIWKATIAARLNGVEVEVRGARPRELRDWLWDFEARPLAPGEREALAGSARAGKVFCLFTNERLRRPTLAKRGLAPILPDEWERTWPRAGSHFRRLAGHPAFAPDVAPYLQKLER